MRNAKAKRAKAGNRKLAAEAQRRWVNHMFATRPDELLLPPGEEREEIHGKGKWKAWTATASQRVAFAGPHRSARDVAKQARGSHRHVRVIQDGSAEELIRRQAHACTEALSQRSEYFVYDVMHDASQKRLVAGGASFTKPSAHEICAVHGGLTWKPEGGAEPSETVVVPPRCMAANDTDCITAVLETSPVSVCLPQVQSSKLRGAVIMSDAAEYNFKFVRDVVARTSKAATGNSHPTLVAFMSCKQHQTCICLSNLSVASGLVGNTFATSKVMAKGQVAESVYKSTRKLLMEKLIIAETHDVDPSAEEHNSALLELTYYPRCLYDRHGESRPDVVAAEEERRRTRGAELQKLLPDKWSGLFVLCAASYK